MLVTRISPVGYPTGYWGLPGGGVDHGEAPDSALRRELYEETSLEALSVRLVDVHDVHVVEIGREDAYEDYHGVHLLYAVTVDTRVEPHVVDVDGTTDQVRWVRLDQIGTQVQPVLPVVSYVLERLDQFGSR